MPRSDGIEMAHVRKGRERTKFFVVDDKCIGRTCFAPGMFQHRSPMSCGGSRNTGSPDTPCCLNNAYRGCPMGPDGERKEFDKDLGCEVTCVGLPIFEPELAKQRKAIGWRKA